MSQNQREVRAHELLAANLSPKQLLTCGELVTVLGQRSRETYWIDSNHVYLVNKNTGVHDAYTHRAVRLCVSLRPAYGDQAQAYYPDEDFQLTIALRAQHDELVLLRTCGWHSACSCSGCVAFYHGFKRRFKRGFVTGRLPWHCLQRAWYRVADLSFEDVLVTGLILALAATVLGAVAPLVLSIVR